jgi:hypothetical protein
MTGTPHSYCRRRPAFFAGFFTDFLAGIFLLATFLATFFAGVFLVAFLVTVFFVAFFGDNFFAAFLAGAFLAAFFAATFLAGAFFRTSVTVVTAASNAVLMAPATSDAIAIPTPTVAPAFSTTVFSAILKLLNLCVHAQLRIVEVYRRRRTNHFSPFRLFPRISWQAPLIHLAAAAVVFPLPIAPRAALNRTASRPCSPCRTSCNRARPPYPSDRQ